MSTSFSKPEVATDRATEIGQPIFSDSAIIGHRLRKQQSFASLRGQVARSPSQRLRSSPTNTPRVSGDTEHVRKLKSHNRSQTMSSLSISGLLQSTLPTLASEVGQLNIHLNLLQQGPLKEESFNNLFLPVEQSVILVAEEMRRLISHLSEPLLPEESMFQSSWLALCEQKKTLFIDSTVVAEIIRTHLDMLGAALFAALSAIAKQIHANLQGFNLPAFFPISWDNVGEQHELNRLSVIDQAVDQMRKSNHFSNITQPHRSHQDCSLSKESKKLEVTSVENLVDQMVCSGALWEGQNGSEELLDTVLHVMRYSVIPFTDFIAALQRTYQQRPVGITNLDERKSWAKRHSLVQTNIIIVVQRLLQSYWTAAFAQHIPFLESFIQTCEITRRGSTHHLRPLLARVQDSHLSMNAELGAVHPCDTHAPSFLSHSLPKWPKGFQTKQKYDNLRSYSYRHFESPQDTMHLAQQITLIQCRLYHAFDPTALLEHYIDHQASCSDCPGVHAMKAVNDFQSTLTIWFSYLVASVERDDEPFVASVCFLARLGKVFRDHRDFHAFAAVTAVLSHPHLIARFKALKDTAFSDEILVMWEKFNKQIKDFDNVLSPAVGVGENYSSHSAGFVPISFHCNLISKSVASYKRDRDKTEREGRVLIGPWIAATNAVRQLERWSALAFPWDHDDPLQSSINDYVKQLSTGDLEQHLGETMNLFKSGSRSHAPRKATGLQAMKCALRNIFNTS